MNERNALITSVTADCEIKRIEYEINTLKKTGQKWKLYGEHMHLLL